MPLYVWVGGVESDQWMILLFLLVALAGMRLVPAILRRLLPFSSSIRAVWARRRTVAKRHDSYQWRKLAGVGLGWLAYLVFWGSFRSPAKYLALACLIAGLCGAVLWRIRKVKPTSQVDGIESNPKPPMPE